MHRRLKRMPAAALAALLAATLLALAGIGPAAASNPVANAQRGTGLPYEIPGTQVFDLPDTVRKIPYQIYVSLPPS